MNIYPTQTLEIDAGRSIGHANPAIDQACQEIKAACAGFGTNEDKLNEVLGTKSPTERCLIHLRYPELFNKTLLSEISSETGGSYGKLIQLLAQPIEQAEATLIRDATKGAGTNEKLLIPVLSGRSNQELNILKKAFFKIYQKDLVVTINDELSGDLKTFYLAALNQMAQDYNPSIHTPAKAAEIADTIYKAGEGKWGTDESTFCNAICSVPGPFLAAVDAAYNAKHEHGLVLAIQKEFGGKAEDGLVFHVNSILRPIETVAELFESTMKGMGTDEIGLSAAIVRYQHILAQVKQAYHAKYGRSLRQRIEGETSGDYRKLLLTILERAG
ncbi:Annexin (Annexin) Family [Achlya hypogyna]|uniref:Annexin (Annexin) Family n=1 Tax=Achlya hypogyna TaxID=1202772 RepID=A0A1V9Z3H1_ACHHY|nr:Annexin (Annexin) Family [Achlya hypogyna]